MAATRLRRRRRLLVLLAAVALAAGALASGIGSDLIRRSGPVGSQPGRAGSGGATSLLLAVPTAGGDSFLALAGGPRRGSSASVLLMPTAVQVEVPSLGSVTLGDALRIRGLALAALAVENALGVRVSGTLLLDREGLAALLGPAGTVEVRLRSTVRLEGRTFPAGVHPLATGDLLRLLLEPRGTALDHLVVVHAVLEGWVSALDPETAAETARRVGREVGLGHGGRRALATFLARLGARHVVFDALDVESLSLPGEERYRLAPSAESEARELFPGLVTAGGGPRLRVEVLNGTGEPGLAERVANRLVPRGIRIVLTGNAARFGVEETVVIVHNRARVADAARVAGLLGVGELRMARNPISLVDVSIVVGEDFTSRAV